MHIRRQDKNLNGIKKAHRFFMYILPQELREKYNFAYHTKLQDRDAIKLVSEVKVNRLSASNDAQSGAAILFRQVYP